MFDITSSANFMNIPNQPQSEDTVYFPSHYLSDGCVVTPLARWNQAWNLWEPIFIVARHNIPLIVKHVAGGAEVPPVVAESGQSVFGTLMLANLAAVHYIHNSHGGGKCGGVLVPIPN